MNTFNTILLGSLGGLSMGIFHCYITSNIITKQNRDFDIRMRLMQNQMIQMQNQMIVLKVIVGNKR